MKFTKSIGFSVSALALVCATVAPAQTKKAMEIEAFDYSTVMTGVQAIFGTQQNIGQGIIAMMTKRIAQDGKYTVVERRKVANIIKEQDFDASNRVKQGSGARIGQIRGADLTMMGDIVVFGRDDRRNSGGGGVVVGGVGVGGGGYKATDKAVVVLDYRIVDTETSEVVLSGEARGESKRTSKGGGGGFFVGGVGVGGGFNMASSNFAETIIGEAVMDAVDKLAIDINSKGLTGGAEGRENDLDAKVADVSGNSITINAGTAAGLRPGQTFTVYHKGKEIKDPTTGEVLDVQTTPLGQITLTVVRDRISIGTYAGAGVPVVGDVVRK
jgi:curli biogenesis system outer membrane secretion channel CsgG